MNKVKQKAEAELWFNFQKKNIDTSQISLTNSPYIGLTNKVDFGGLVTGWNTLPGVTHYGGHTWETPWGTIGDDLALRAFAPGRAGCQLCALAMCCHLLSAAMPDHVLEIRCFPIYLYFIEVNKQLSTCVQSHVYSLYS